MMMIQVDKPFSLMDQLVIQMDKVCDDWREYDSQMQTRIYSQIE